MLTGLPAYAIFGQKHESMPAGGDKSTQMQDIKVALQLADVLKRII